jgi:hypothetical protein
MCYGYRAIAPNSSLNSYLFPTAVFASTRYAAHEAWRVVVARTYGTISAAHEHGVSTEPTMLEHVFCLLQTLHAQQQTQTPAPVIELHRNDYTTLVTGYQRIWQALERAGLHVDHEPIAVDSAAPVWFFRWHVGPRHGPFATLDAALAAALDRVHPGGAETNDKCACSGTNAHAGG